MRDETMGSFSSLKTTFHYGKKFKKERETLMLSALIALNAVTNYIFNIGKKYIYYEINQVWAISKGERGVLGETDRVWAISKGER